MDLIEAESRMVIPEAEREGGSGDKRSWLIDIKTEFVKKNNLGRVANTCNPSTLGGQGRGIT